MSQTQRTAPALLAIAAIALLAVTACGAGTASQAGPGTSPNQTAAHAEPLPALVTIDRSGGFAGIRQRIVIEKTGAWTVTGPAPAVRTGLLSPDQLGSLRMLIDGTTWWADGRRPPSPADCPDGYVYVVAIAEHTATADDCAMDRLSTLGEIVTLLISATGSSG